MRAELVTVLYFAYPSKDRYVFTQIQYWWPGRVESQRVSREYRPQSKNNLCNTSIRDKNILLHMYIIYAYVYRCIYMYIDTFVRKALVHD